MELDVGRARCLVRVPKAPGLEQSRCHRTRLEREILQVPPRPCGGVGRCDHRCDRRCIRRWRRGRDDLADCRRPRADRGRRERRRPPTRPRARSRRAAAASANRSRRKMTITSRSARNVSVPPVPRRSTPTARPFSTMTCSVVACRAARSRLRRDCDRLQIRARCRRALGVAGGQLVVADALLRRAVEIVVEGNAGLLRRAQEGEADRRRVDGIGDAERTAVGVIALTSRWLSSRALEIRQNVAVTPTLASRIRDPCVIVLGVAAGVELGVDRRTAADDFGLRVPDRRGRRDASAARCSSPSWRRPWSSWRSPPACGTADAHRRRRPRAATPSDRRVLAQSVGEHAAGGAAADDDVVVRHPSLPTKDRFERCDRRRAAPARQSSALD